MSVSDGGVAMPCDKCPKRHAGQPATGRAFCLDCRKIYRRCALHGGLNGALRSLHSHRALVHPQQRYPTKPTKTED